MRTTQIQCMHDKLHHEIQSIYLTLQTLPMAHTVIKNGFKDRQLAPQITTSFSTYFILAHMPPATSQEVTYLKVTPQLARLTVKFLRVGCRKEGAPFGDISNHFDPIHTRVSHFCNATTPS